MKENLLVVSIFDCVDIHKTFDTVEHDILLTKFEHYGVRGLAKD